VTTETWAMASLWAVTLLWNLITALALLDAALGYMEERRTYSLVEGGNGRAVVARFRRRIAGHFLIGFILCEAVGLIAFARLAAGSPSALDPAPSPFSVAVSTTLRTLLIGIVFVFWRASRNGRTMTRAVQEYNDRAADARGVAQDARSVRQDVRSVSQTERGSLQDARGDKQDEREARQDERDPGGGA
jgi:hypothetical protein